MAFEPNLTGQNIQDTYQRVIQTDGDNFYDGTGSLIQIVTSAVTSSMTVATASFAISASHEITFELSSSYSQTASYVENAQTASFVSGLTGTNSGDITLTGTPDYITISGQEITRNQIDLANDVTGILPSANLDTDTAHLTTNQTFTGDKTFSGALTASAGLTVTGDVSASGTVYAEHIRSVDDIEVNDRIMKTDDNNVMIDFAASQIDFKTSATAQNQFHSSKTSFNVNSTNMDFQVKGDSDANCLYIDGSEDSVGIGTATPGEKLEVVGNISASGNLIGIINGGSFN